MTSATENSKAMASLLRCFEAAPLRSARGRRPNGGRHWIFIFGPPAGGALREQVEEVPDRAEIVARREPGVGDAEDLAAALLVHRYARHPAIVAAIAHVGGEAGVPMRHHAESPAARCPKFSLFPR